MTEQRYKAVQAVIAAGRTVGEVAAEWGVCRQTLHRWLARYDGEGMEGLGNRSSRPAHCPHQTPPEVEAMVLEMRRAHAYWGPRRIAFELARKGVERSTGTEVGTVNNSEWGESQTYRSRFVADLPKGDSHPSCQVSGHRAGLLQVIVQWPASSEATEAGHGPPPELVA